MKKFLLSAGKMLILTMVVLNSCKKEDAPTWEDMLTGGPTAKNGKTWVLSDKNYPAQDGAGDISPGMAIIKIFPDNVLTINSLGGEYDNEFTFFSDGRYVINPVNGIVLSGIIYAIMSQTLVPGTESTLGFCAANYTPPAKATWKLNSTDMVVENAITDPTTTAIPPVRSNVTFTGVKWLSFSPGAYLGIHDYAGTAKVIIKEITKDRMHVALLLCNYAMTFDPSGDGLQYANSPTWFVQFTLVPKAK